MNKSESISRYVNFFKLSSIILPFYYLAPLQNDALVTSRCVQFTFGDNREVNLLDESALPVTEKESRQKGNILVPNCGGAISE